MGGKATPLFHYGTVGTIVLFEVIGGAMLPGALAAWIKRKGPGAH